MLRMLKKCASFIVVFVSILKTGAVQDIARCSLATTCGACISSPDCAWCSSSNFSWLELGSRCEREPFLLEAGCPPEFIFNPANSMEVLGTDPSDDEQINSKKSPVHLTPSKLHLHLRPNSPVKFKLKFEQAKNYPVDLYYLMDLTWSMKDHKDKLAELADALSDSISNITTNFRLGYGSFIDKVVMPFASMLPSKLKNPCTDDFECAPPYGFRNHLSLTENSKKFVEEVTAASLSANLDNAEGGFDAIMQVIVCKNKIEWGESSRKMIIFATDSIFHSAGDGKLGGIVKPNDGECHLDDQGFYTESVHQDYPSLSQINRVIAENKVNIIFAVPSEALPVYEKLSSHIEGSVAGMMSNDSTNIVDLIRHNYEKIVSRIELQDDSSSIVEMRYFSRCLGSSLRETNVCEDVPVGEQVEFDVELKVIGCPINRNNYSFKISPVGIREYAVITLNISCSCRCEDYPEIESLSCSNKGNLTCGICECPAKRFGKNCECEGDTTLQEKSESCKQNVNETNYCSGRGKCLCGVCECSQGPTWQDAIFGKHCECDTFSCERDGAGLTCGGPTRGQCCEGQCRCHSGWSGGACSCSQKTETCINPSNDKICSGHGDCNCGQCRCHLGEGIGEGQNVEYYDGAYCETCLTCEGRCTELEPCVKCLAFGSGPYSEADCSERCPYAYQLVDDVDIDVLPTDKRCVFIDEDNCQFSFIYSYDQKTSEALIRVKKDRDCALPLNFYIILASIAGAVFLIGLIVLLIFRSLVYLKDKRDYLNWMAEVEKTKANMNEVRTNPLYKEAQVEYQNPMYKTQSESLT